MTSCGVVCVQWCALGARKGNAVLVGSALQRALPGPPARRSVGGPGSPLDEVRFACLYRAIYVKSLLIQILFASQNNQL